MLNHCTVTWPNPFKKTGHIKEERLSYVSYCSVLFWEIKLTKLHLGIMEYCWVNKEVHFKARACSHLDRNPVIVLYIFTLSWDRWENWKAWYLSAAGKIYVSLTYTATCLKVWGISELLTEFIMQKSLNTADMFPMNLLIWILWHDMLLKTYKCSLPFLVTASNWTFS